MADLKITELTAASSWLDTDLHEIVQGGINKKITALLEKQAAMAYSDANSTVFVKLLGRSGGQAIIGGTGSGDNLTFQSTSHVTKGKYTFLELNVANGIVQTDVSGNLSSSINLPDGTTATTQTAGNNTIKVSTTAFITAAISTLDGLVVHKAGTETIIGVKTFDVAAIPVYSSHPTFSSDTQIVDKKYVDDSAAGGGFWQQLTFTAQHVLAPDESYAGLLIGDNTVLGGNQINAPGGSILGGSSNVVNGLNGTVLAGHSCLTTGDNVVVGGNRAKAAFGASFIWADALGYDFQNTATYQVMFRATGGFGINTAPTAGCALDVAGVYAPSGTVVGAFLMPRLTTTQRDTLTPVAGMQIYNPTIGYAQFYESGVWTTPSLAPNLWTRVGTTLSPTIADDNVDMGNGSIVSTSSANTSFTKTYQIIPTLTSAAPGAESGEIALWGLRGGTGLLVYSYNGLSNEHDWVGQDYIFTNDNGTVTQDIHKTNLNTIGGTGFYLNQINAKNSSGADVTYAQTAGIITRNNAGTEGGKYSISVAEPASAGLVEYFSLDGFTGLVNALKALHVAGDIVSVEAGTDGYLSALNASSVEKVHLDTNGSSWLTGGSFGVGTTAPSRKFHVSAATALLTNTVNYDMRLTHTTSGTPAAGIGVGIEFEQQTTAGNELIGFLNCVTTNVGAGTEASKFSWTVLNAGISVNTMFVDGTGLNLINPGANKLLYSSSTSYVDGTTLGALNQPLLSGGATSAPVFGTMAIGSSVLSAAGALPVTSDLSTWGNTTLGMIVGTGGRMFLAYKNASAVGAFVELT